MHMSADRVKTSPKRPLYEVVSVAEKAFLRALADYSFEKNELLKTPIQQLKQKREELLNKLPPRLSQMFQNALELLQSVDDRNDNLSVLRKYIRDFTKILRDMPVHNKEIINLSVTGFNAAGNYASTFELGHELELGNVLLRLQMAVQRAKSLRHVMARQTRDAVESGEEVKVACDFVLSMFSQLKDSTRISPKGIRILKVLVPSLEDKNQVSERINDAIRFLITTAKILKDMFKSEGRIEGRIDNYLLSTKDTRIAIRHMTFYRESHAVAYVLFDMYFSKDLEIHNAEYVVLCCRDIGVEVTKPLVAIMQKILFNSIWKAKATNQ
jgi:hypothetical protein